MRAFRRRRDCSAVTQSVLNAWDDRDHARIYGYPEVEFEWDSRSYAFFDVETRGLYGELLLAGFLLPNGKTVIAENALDMQWWLDKLRSDGCRLVIHNASYDVAVVRLHGGYIPPSQVVDTLVLAHYRHNTRSKSLDSLTGSKLDLFQEAKRIGYARLTPDMNELHGWVFDKDKSLLIKYLKQDLVATQKLFLTLEKYLNPFTQAATLYTCRLADMKVSGIPIDRDAVRIQKEELKEVIANLEWIIRGILGFTPVTGNKTGKKKVEYPQCDLPWKSPSSQNKGIYLASLGVSNLPTTGSGAYCMDRDAVTALLLRDDLSAEAREFLEICRDYDRARKAHAMLEHLDGTSAHPSFRFVDTGRLSCSDPNLQQIPKPSDKPGGKMRQVIIPEPGYSLVIGDESSFQLRILAAYLEFALKDRTLSDWFVRYDAGLESEDLHTFLARIYGLIPEGMTEDHPEFKGLRGISKNCTFGRVFGAGANKIAETAFKAGSGKSLKELKQQISKALAEFDAKIPRKKLTELAKEAILEQEGVTHDWFGRRYFWDDIIAEDRLHTRQLVMHVQGMEASIMTLFQVRATSVEARYRGRLLFPVHDEVVYQFPTDVADRAASILSKIYSYNVFKLESVITPKAAFSVYNNWSESK